MLWIKGRIYDQIFEIIKNHPDSKFCIIKKLLNKVYLITDIDDCDILFEIIQNNFKQILDLTSREEEAIVILNTSHPFDIEGFHWAIVKPKQKAEEIVKELVFDYNIYSDTFEKLSIKVDYKGDLAIITLK
jgi:hypothetical protein